MNHELTLRKQLAVLENTQMLLNHLLSHLMHMNRVIMIDAILERRPVSLSDEESQVLLKTLNVSLSNLISDYKAEHVRQFDHEMAKKMAEVEKRT